MLGQATAMGCWAGRKRMLGQATEMGCWAGRKRMLGQAKAMGCWAGLLARMHHGQACGGTRAGWAGKFGCIYCFHFISFPNFV
jgi:hypothetical protein